MLGFSFLSFSVQTLEHYCTVLVYNDPTIHSHRNTTSPVCKNLEEVGYYSSRKKSPSPVCYFPCRPNRMLFYDGQLSLQAIYSFCIILHSRIQMLDGRRNDWIFPCWISDSLQQSSWRITKTCEGTLLHESPALPTHSQPPTLVCMLATWGQEGKHRIM